VEGEGYPEFARTAFHLVVHGTSPSSVTLDRDDVAGRAGRYELANAGTAFTAELAL